MNKTVLIILGAIGSMILVIIGSSVSNWANKVDAAVTKVVIIETLLPTMNATVETVKTDVTEIKKDVKELRKDVAKISREK